MSLTKPNLSKLSAGLIIAMAMAGQSHANENTQKETPEQAAAIAAYMPDLPKPSDVRPGVSDAAQDQFPMSNEEIQWVKEQMKNNQYALHKGAPIKQRNLMIPVSVDPGSSAPTIHVLPGYVSAISIVGKDGTVWPIVTESTGSPRQFAVASPAQTRASGGAGKEGETNGAPRNLLTIQPLFFGANTNIMLTLQGLDTPLLINVDSGSPSDTTTDGHVTLRVNRDAPDTPPPILTPPPPSPIDSTLFGFLEKAPPKGAVTLTTNTPGVMAWSWNDNVIVRSRDTLVIPAWTAQVSQDGVSVYEVPQTDTITVRGTTGTINIVLGSAK